GAVPCHRGAFSLLELLVVIAIIAVILGLLLGGVMQARAAVARTECANRLRQICLALHGYHHRRGVLPPGMSYLGRKSTEPFMGWHTRILPFLEQEALWQNALAAYKANPVFQVNPPHTGAGMVLRAYTCPADGRTQEPARLGSGLFACTDYL